MTARQRDDFAVGTLNAWTKLSVRVAALLVPCAYLCLLLLDEPDFLVSSDSLFPAAFVWDLMHTQAAWLTVQQPHIPSFFPDLLVYGPVQALTGSWRMASAVWVFVVLGWLAAILSWITARIARSSLESATLCVLALLVLVMTGAAWGLPRFVPVSASDDPFFPWLLILMPYTHGGPFLLALTVAAIASQAVVMPSAMKMVWLGLLAFATELSDQLCLISLLVPLTTAIIGGLLVKTVARKPALAILSCVWGASALGSVCLRLLDRQAMPLPSPDEMLGHIGGFANGLAHHGGMSFAMTGLVLMLATAVWRRGLRGFLGNFWLMFAATGAAGSLALTMLLYEDVWSYRYALPMLWWAFALAAATMAEVSSRRRFTMSLGSAAVLVSCLMLVWPEGTALAGGLSAAVSRMPRLFGGESALASCLRQTGLGAGLADYWVARKTSAETDWDLQIDPIDSVGEARVWGNNRSWFTHDIHDETRRPSYRFIVMDRLTPALIAPVYGQPDRVTMCGSSTVWLYDDPARVYRNLERASPFLADLFAAAPAR